MITELPVPQSFDVIIGMDIITHGDFSITNVSGTKWLSFRIPSSRELIDYVVEATKDQIRWRETECPLPVRKWQEVQEMP